MGREKRNGAKCVVFCTSEAFKVQIETSNQHLATAESRKIFNKQQEK
jgi:hypothetical protein